MNKSVKANIVAQAISAKFKSEYEKAFRAVVVAARKFAITNSKHNEFMALKLPTDMLLHVQSDSYVTLSNYIISGIDFIGKIRSISFDDPVYGFHGSSYIRDEHLPELEQLRKLVKEIDKESEGLACVINSYTTAKKLVDDLPWTEQYLPTASKCTGLNAIEVIAYVNAKFGK